MKIFPSAIRRKIASCYRPYEGISLFLNSVTFFSFYLFSGKVYRCLLQLVPVHVCLEVWYGTLPMIWSACSSVIKCSEIWATLCCFVFFDKFIITIQLNQSMFRVIPGRLKVKNSRSTYNFVNRWCWITCTRLINWAINFQTQWWISLTISVSTNCSIVIFNIWTCDTLVLLLSWKRIVMVQKNGIYLFWG